jgi:hypothetical protein
MSRNTSPTSSDKDTASTMPTSNTTTVQEYIQLDFTLSNLFSSLELLDAVIDDTPFPFAEASDTDVESTRSLSENKANYPDPRDHLSMIRPGYARRVQIHHNNFTIWQLQDRSMETWTYSLCADQEINDVLQRLSAITDEGSELWRTLRVASTRR